VTVEVGAYPLLEDREHIVNKCGPSGHPLEVGPAAMRVRAIQTRTREPIDEPTEQQLVADVHPQCDLRLPSVASERSFSDEHTDEDPAVELVKRRGVKRVSGHR
jgi:hypothetical protein